MPPKIATTTVTSAMSARFFMLSAASRCIPRFSQGHVARDVTGCWESRPFGCWTAPPGRGVPSECHGGESDDVSGCRTARAVAPLRPARRPRRRDLARHQPLLERRRRRRRGGRASRVGCVAGDVERRTAGDGCRRRHLGRRGRARRRTRRPSPLPSRRGTSRPRPAGRARGRAGRGGEPAATQVEPAVDETPGESSRRRVPAAPRSRAPTARRASEVAAAAAEGKPTDAKPIAPGPADATTDAAAKPETPGRADTTDRPARAQVPAPRNDTPPGLADTTDRPAPAQGPTETPPTRIPPRSRHLRTPRPLAAPTRPTGPHRHRARTKPAQLRLPPRFRHPERRRSGSGRHDDRPAPAQGPTETPGQLLAPQNDTPPGLADKDPGAPAVEATPGGQPTELPDGPAHPADALPPGLADAPGRSLLSLTAEAVRPARR